MARVTCSKYIHDAEQLPHTMKSNCHLKRVGDLQDQEHIHQVDPLHRLEAGTDSLRLEENPITFKRMSQCD